MTMWKWKRKPAPVFTEDYPFRLDCGWTELRWPGCKARDVKIYDCLKCLEQFVLDHPEREFTVRFVQRDAGGPRDFLRPIGSLAARIGKDGRVGYFEIGL